MAVTYSDAEIAALLAERKPLPTDWQIPLQLKQNGRQSERQFDLTSERSSEFLLILRQSLINALDFSVILAVRVPGSSRVFRLRRHNGPTHRHGNQLEGDSFVGFHIHTATERYQAQGLREDGFAQPTDRYTDFDGALTCMIEDAHFR